MIKLLTISLISLSLLGCANKFAENYKSTATINNPLYVNTGEQLEVIESNDINTDLKKLLEQGYMTIGTSKFVANSGSQSLSNLRKHGELVGAHKILVNRKYLGSSTIPLAMTTPTVSTSSTNSNYNITNNYGGNANIYGNSRTTTYGTQTQYIPFTVSSTGYSAYYLAKFKSKTGIYPFELTDQDKQEIGQNTGFKVGVIINESPSYYGGILVNDIVTEVNGNQVNGVKGFVEIVDTLPIGIAHLKVYRNGKYLNKQININ